jgi:hypothetical protein
MTRTTEILLHVDVEDEDLLTELSFWLQSEAPRADERVDGPTGHLLPMTGEIGAEASGGFKLPAATIWGGVSNYLDVNAFVAETERVPWRRSEAVQAFIRDDGDPWFRMYMIRDG